MSMKRAKQRTGGRDQDIETDFWKKPTEPEKTWEQQVADKPDEAFAPYAMTEKFTLGQLLLHTKFGKGVVVDVEALRVEILFQEGRKKLGHAQPS